MRDNGKYAQSSQDNFYYTDGKWYEKFECLPFAVLAVAVWVIVLAVSAL